MGKPTFIFPCPKCRRELRVSEELVTPAGKVSCPHCEATAAIPAEVLDEFEQMRARKETARERKAQSARDKAERKEQRAREGEERARQKAKTAMDKKRREKAREETREETIPPPVSEQQSGQEKGPEHRDDSTEKTPFSLHMKVAGWIGAVGLLVLALSPLFNWVNIGVGGVTGITGDGKIVLGLTVAAIAAYIVGLSTRKKLTPVLLAVQSWGTVAVFWMGGLIWQVSVLLKSPELEDNPFAALIATQAGPGAGLYLGLVGALAVAGGVGFFAVRYLLRRRAVKFYCVAQGLSCAVGIAVAFLVGFERSADSDTNNTASKIRAAHAVEGVGSTDSGVPFDSEPPPEEKELPSGQASREKEEYVRLVDLYSFQAKYYTTFLDERVPGVEFKLRNRGERTLKLVEVTVYFKDARGQVISEENYHPVLVSSFSLDSSSKPLKPGYVWQMESDKFYPAKNVPTEWQEGNALAKITDLEFVEE